jgi:AMP deaminase
MAHDDLSEDEEPYPHEQDVQDSDDSWDGTPSEQGSMQPGAGSLANSGTVLERDTCDGAQDGMLPRDMQRRTAYYDYAAEKQMSQADAKLIYQRRQLETQVGGGSARGSQYSPQGSPVIGATWSMSNISSLGGNTDDVGMFRSRSTRSIPGGQNLVNQSV